MNLISNSSLATSYLRNQLFFSSNTLDFYSVQHTQQHNLCKNRAILKSKIIRPSHFNILASYNGPP